MGSLELLHISKSFDHHPALVDINLEVGATEILALLGPSGCGKTTLLRVIAGLEKPDSGTVLFDGNDMNAVPVHKRHFGLMFQDYALFPHMNVRDNVAYGLRFQNLTRHDTTPRARELLELVGLSDLASREVSDLSGGEKQRVALARSLAPSPRLLMLDEPLAALDRALRDHLGLEIKAILKKLGLPAILVTHDQTEAFAMADKVAVMDSGSVLQCLPPNQLYDQPKDAKVAHFLGLTNVIREGNVWTMLGGDEWKGRSLLIRPEAASLTERAGSVPVEAIVIESVFRGQFSQVRVAMCGEELSFVLERPLPPGRITLFLDRDKIRFLPG